MGVDPVDEVGGLCVHSWVAGLGAPGHVFLLYFCVFVFARIFILFVFNISHTERFKILTYTTPIT